MKRGFRFLAVLAGVLALSCGWFDWHNDIEYPIRVSHMREWPGDSIILYLYFSFSDQTPDTSGVEFDWSRRGDTLWFLFQGTDGDIDRKGPYDSYLHVNLGVLDTGTYTLLFEGEDGVIDTFGFEVEDSLYRFVHESDSGKVVYFPYYHSDTLRRIFPDMLLVEAGYLWSQPYEENLDSLENDILNLGASVCHPPEGQYTMFKAGATGGVQGDRMDQWPPEYMDNVQPTLYTYQGDTTDLDAMFNKYIIIFPALSIRMGNGFDRYYRDWVD